jgi:hypothetical protein
MDLRGICVGDERASSQAGTELERWRRQPFASPHSLGFQRRRPRLANTTHRYTAFYRHITA